MEGVAELLERPFVVIDAPVLAKLPCCYGATLPAFQNLVKTKQKDLVDGSTSCDRRVGREKTRERMLCSASQWWRARRAAGDAIILMWQPNPAGVAEDEAVSMDRVGCVEQSVFPSVEPREYRVCRSYTHRCVEGEEPCQVAILIRSCDRCGNESRRDSELRRDAQSAVQQPRGGTCAKPEQTISGVTFRWDVQLTGSAAAWRPKDLHARESDCCNATQREAETRLHREGCQKCTRCRESIRQTMMSDDIGQQKLHEMEQRRATTEGTGGQESSAQRVERAQEARMRR